MSANDPRIQTLYLTADNSGQRLDQYVAAMLTGVSRSEVQRLIKASAIRVNGRATKASLRLEPGDEVAIDLPQPEPQTVEAQSLPLTAIYEDADIVVIDKPAGMVVHPAYGNREGTLVNAALARWPEMRAVGDDESRAGIVHRLDKDTSGVIALARTQAALESLQAQFKARTTEKHYLALVEGVPPSGSGIIDAPIGRDPKRRKRMAVIRSGREAQTRYDVLEDLQSNALIDAAPRTGRTHQIRVHLAWLGHPVVGDRLYGFRKQRIRLRRLFLHAASLSLDHPTTGERMTFEAPLPPGLEDILAKLRRNLRAGFG